MRAVGTIALLFGSVAVVAVGWYGAQTLPAKYRASRRAAALEDYRQRVDHDDPTAEALLARMYSDGDGVPRDYAQALSLYRKSADQGSAAGEAGLGATYYYGRGVPVDYQASWNWYNRAAVQGNRYAQNAVGTMLADGLGTTRDYGQALNWFRKAADRHYARAEYNLGRMYYDGRGISEDRAEAYRWFDKAADDGDEDAQQFLSMGLSKPSEIRIGILFAFGLYCVLGISRTNHASQIGRAGATNLKIILATGLLCIFSAIYAWYGYTHHLMRRLGAGMNAFTTGRWVMDAAVLLLFIWIMRRPSKRQAGE
jgi:tetratricopeptide (TPR) repeat protein